jgi:hypothetical protein
MEASPSRIPIPISAERYSAEPADPGGCHGETVQSARPGGVFFPAAADRAGRRMRRDRRRARVRTAAGPDERSGRSEPAELNGCAKFAGPDALVLPGVGPGRGWRPAAEAPQSRPALASDRGPDANRSGSRGPTSGRRRPGGPPMRLMDPMDPRCSAPGATRKHGRRRQVRGGRASPWRPHASITGGLAPNLMGDASPISSPLRCIYCAKNTPVFRAKDGRRRRNWGGRASRSLPPASIDSACVLAGARASASDGPDEASPHRADRRGYAGRRVRPPGVDLRDRAE